jgi:hypothetical protein
VPTGDVSGFCLASRLGALRKFWHMKGHAQLGEAPFNVRYFPGGPFKQEQRSRWFTRRQREYMMPIQLVTIFSEAIRSMRCQQAMARGACSVWFGLGALRLATPHVGLAFVAETQLRARRGQELWVRHACLALRPAHLSRYAHEIFYLKSLGPFRRGRVFS